MSFTLAELDERLSGWFDEPAEMTTTANGAADGTTLICSELLMKPAQSYTMYECEITSGARDGDRRLIRDFSVSGTTATLTPYNAFGGQVLSGVTFRLHDIGRDIKYQAINAALRELHVTIPCLVSEDIIAGEILRNPHLEFWRTPSQPADWEIYQGTVSRESSIVYEGKYAMRINGVGSVRQRIPLEKELYNLTLTLTGYIYDTAESLWYAHEVELEVGNSTEPLYIWLENTSEDDIIVDALHLSIPTTNPVYWLPHSEIYRNLSNVQIGPDPTQTPSQSQRYRDYRMPHHYERGYGWYPEGLGYNGKAFLRLNGTGSHINDLTETDSVDIDGEAADYLVVLAGLRAIHAAKASHRRSDPDHWNKTEADLNIELAKLQNSLKRAAPPVRFTSWRRGQ